MVQQVRRALGTRAVGHTGTLDPFATGLLVALVGKGTRVARFVEQQPKTYLGVARLGVETDTDDLTGRAVEVGSGAVPDPEAVRDALGGFVGTIVQVPPAFSAKRVAGERSHRLARRGEAVQPRPVAVTVERLEVLSIEGADVTFRTTVSPGTYIRALARDLGRELGVGGHLRSLRREAIGSIRVEEAVPLDAVRQGVEPMSLSRVLEHLPAMTLGEDAVLEIAHGRPVEAPAGSRGLMVLCRGEDVVALAQAEDGWLRPKVVLVAP